MAAIELSFFVLIFLVSGLVLGENSANLFLSYTPINVEFCHSIKLMRSIYSTNDGFEFMYKKIQYQSFRQVKVSHNFMVDEYYQYEEPNEVFVTSAFYLPQFKIDIGIGIRSAQIVGSFKNHHDTFDLGYAAHFNDYVEQYWQTHFQYFYGNKCYIKGCISNTENLFRVNKLGFCRDTGFVCFFALNDPCYHFYGKNTTFTYFIDQKRRNPKCISALNPYVCRPNLSCVKHPNDTAQTLNTLFPEEYSRLSAGGMFRSMAYFNDTLIWIESTPFKYRYLQDINDPYGDYTMKWITANVQPKTMTDNYYFSGAFVFPGYGNYLDELFFLLLPKNFTTSTVATLRKATSILPHLVLDSKEYSLEEILKINCSRLMAAPPASDNPQLVAVVLVVFMVIFLVLITLLTVKIETSSPVMSAQSDHSQSQLLSKLQRNSASQLKVTKQK